MGLLITPCYTTTMGGGAPVNTLTIPVAVGNANALLTGAFANTLAGVSGALHNKNGAE